MIMLEKLEDYLKYLEFKKRVSPVSLKNYASTLRRFCTWLEENNLTLSAENAEDWLCSIKHSPSLNVYAVRLQGFAKFLGTPMELTRAKEPTRIVEALSSSEVERLIEATEEEFRPFVTFLADTGLRFSELQNLRFKTLEEREGLEGLKITGKGQKDRWIALSKRSRAILYDICGKVPLAPYQEERFRKALAEAGKRAGLYVHVHPHLLRASCISIMLNERKAEAVSVAKYVGHSNLNTMLVHYFRPSAQTLYSLVGD